MNGSAGGTDHDTHIAAKPHYGGRNVTCLACGGRGYQTTIDYMNVPRPIVCRGCNGSGSQRVAS